MKIKIKIICLVLFLGLSAIVYSRPKYNPVGDHFVPPTPMTNVAIQQVGLDKNNINSFFMNTGIFDQDLRTTNTPGFEWPYGTGQDAIFTCGLSIIAYVGGSLKGASCMYLGELAPGYVTYTNGNPVAQTDSRFRIYKVYATDAGLNPKPPDYQSWGDMVPYGAPYVDINHNGIYDPGIDIPGIKDAAETIFMCLTDGFPTEHKAAEGFGGGTAPIFEESHVIAWCYNTPGLENMQFVQFTVINRNTLPWQKTYMGLTTDPDLGCANDDYIGCDTSRNLGYDWNGEDVDCNYPYRYSGIVPAVGLAYFRSPIIPGAPTDSVVYYIPPGSTNRIVKHGFKTIGMTSFDFFTNNTIPHPICESDPNPGELLAYHYLQGLKSDASPWMVPPGGDSLHVTKFCYPGDPETGIGWCESGGTPSGSVQNCGGPGHYSGTVVPSNQFADRRMIFNSGSDFMTINPGDTQIIQLAQLIAKGSSRQNSVTQLKHVDDIAQKIFDGNFNVIPPPPQPKVTISGSQLTNRGNYALTLSWTDTSEFYNFRDTLFGLGGDTLVDSLKSYYRFEGYEVWELQRSAQQTPDLSKPGSDFSSLQLLAIFDKIDNIGVISDTFPTGPAPGQYGVYPVVPPFNMTNPVGFPNYGVTRSITINRTLFPTDNNGSGDLIYGHDYKFLVTAYAYNTHQRFAGQSMIRNSLSASVINIHIEAPPAGTQFFYKNGDTLNSNRRDLGVMPIVKAQELLLDAKYRVVFNNPDTTYNLLRSFDNWQHSTLIKGNLKFADSLTNQNSDDSSRTIDGIDFKVYKLRASKLGPGNYTGNIGVVKDPTNPLLYQTRQYGWDYIPPQNKYVTASKYIYSPQRLWQSVSMNLSYPTILTYTGFRTTMNPEDLRAVQLLFTGYGNGQQAYRYVATSITNYAYQDMREVPFKLYEIDPTDSSPNPRQLNCAFLEFPDSVHGQPDGKWDPTADSLGGKEILYIFNSTYNSAPQTFYTSKNLLLNQSQTDLLYVWAPKLISPGATFQTGDQFIIYPYMTTRPYITPGYPLYYEVTSKKPIIANSGTAVANKDMDKIRIVPNPYYGFNALETPQSGHYVAFRRLPANCTIKIYTLNGDLIRTLTKNDAGTSELRWDMKTLSNVPVASGIYICLIDAPGIGQKVLKAAIFTVEERIDF
jgi:hypothetical protein